jgi:hypothetical protein
MFVFDIHYSPETTVLQFKDEIVIVKSFADEPEAPWLNTRKHL